ncbi:MAG: hypothetical protein JNM34_03880 [Chthonomonadaceae bacterium]|nr:hypothetical protein [Chthonomonadaceae bacterium]
MLNLIPALIFLLAGSTFSTPASDLCIQHDGAIPHALAVNLAKELERAGFSAAQVAYVVAHCECPDLQFTSHGNESPTNKGPDGSIDLPERPKDCRQRDGPHA